MLFKWLITGAIIYFIYQYFIKPAAIDPPRDDRRHTPPSPPPQSSPNDDEGEYIDYEEVE